MKNRIKKLDKIHEPEVGEESIFASIANEAQARLMGNDKKKRFGVILSPNPERADNKKQEIKNKEVGKGRDGM